MDLEIGGKWTMLSAVFFLSFLSFSFLFFFLFFFLASSFLEINFAFQKESYLRFVEIKRNNSDSSKLTSESQFN